MTEIELNKTLKEQNELLKKLLLQSEKTRKHILWTKTLGIIRLIIIITPIIFALVYLPPFVKKAIEKYQAIVPGLDKIIESQK